MTKPVNKDLLNDLTRLRQQAGQPTCPAIATAIGGICGAATLELLFNGKAQPRTTTLDAVVVHLRNLARKRGNPTPEISATISDVHLNVLKLVAQGDNNDQIGAALSISPHTVRVHLRRIYTALGARNRAHAVAIARDHGFRLPARANTLPTRALTTRNVPRQLVRDRAGGGHVSWLICRSRPPGSTTIYGGGR
jgi:DNA-binding CsgD family transcriptional regulator